MLFFQVSSGLHSVRYSVEAEKYRAAAGYMASSGLSGHNLYHGGPVDAVTAAAAAAKYLESSKNFNENHKNFLPELNKGLGDGGAYGKAFMEPNAGNSALSDGAGGNSNTSASKAYLETAKLYMDSKNYAAEVQRAYMDAAAKSYAEKCQEPTGGVGGGSTNGVETVDGVKSADSGSPSNASASSVNFSSPSLGNYGLYGQAAAAAAGVGQTGNGGLAGLPGAGAQSLPGIVPLSLSQYASPTGTYPPSGEYRRPLPVIF